MSLAKELETFDIGKELHRLTTDIILDDDTPDEQFLIKLKQNFNTASWAYLPPSRIYVGEQCLNRAIPSITEDGLRDYLEAFVRHELAHLRWTHRNLIEINVVLQEVGIPFRLWNLFEDARIEHKERARSKRKFNWDKYESAPVQQEGVPPDAALDFFLLIFHENEQRDLRAPEVVEFYDRAIQAKSSMALILILEEWIDRFGLQAPPDRFEVELSTAEQLQQDSQFFADFDNDSTLPSDKPSTTGAPVQIKKRKKSKLLSENTFYVDFAKGEKLANRFLNLFSSRAVNSRSSEPSKRISSRHLELERPFYKHKKQIQVKAKKLCLIIDCSGSMDGSPIEDAKVLAWALSCLAQQNLIQGSLILSAVNKDDDAVSEVFDFPVNKDVISRITAFGAAEGLNSAILQNRAKLAEADMVFIKTDGKICDEPLEKHKVKQMGITVCGLYSGGVENAPYMEEHFERFFVRNSLEGVIDALLHSRLS